jgi:hypothetical protein
LLASGTVTSSSPLTSFCTLVFLASGSYREPTKGKHRGRDEQATRRQRTGTRVRPGRGDHRVLRRGSRPRRGRTLHPVGVLAGGRAGTRGREAARVSWFGSDLTLRREFLFFLAVALAGALGGLIHTIRSFAWYVGNRRLRWSWLPFNLLLPVVGALGGTVFYLVLRAGLFSRSTSVDNASPFGFTAIAVLAGLFSQQAFEKLRQIARDVFTEEPKGADQAEADED